MSVRGLSGGPPRPVFVHHLYHLATIGRGLLRRHPLRPAGGQLDVPPFFIIGSGRSGNTLLRAILASHPHLCIPPESVVLGRVVRNYRFYSFLPWEMLARLVISEFAAFRDFDTWKVDLTPFYRTAGQLPPAQCNLACLLDAFYRYYLTCHDQKAVRWGDKSPINTFVLPLIESVFPQAQYIHIIRDGRDVVASYLAAGLYTDEEVACRRWLQSVQVARRFGARVGPGRYHELFYEELVCRPEATVQRVCDFLGIDFRPAMLDYWQTVGRLGDTALAHHHNVHNPMNPSSIGAWRKRLAPTAAARVQQRLASQLSSLRYPLEQES